MSAPFLSLQKNLIFGSFHYNIGLVNWAMSDRAYALMQSALEQNESVSAQDYGEEALLHDAHQITSYFHEMRHLVDTFGTLAGISLFNAGITLLKKFAHLSDTLRSQGLAWQLPLTDWTRRPDCPQEIKDFVRYAKCFDKGTKLFIAPFDPEEVDGWIEDVIAKVNLKDIGEGDAFPLRILQNPDGPAPRKCSVLYPLGFESLLEGNAHAFSRSFAEQYFPDIGERMHERVHIMRIQAGDSANSSRISDPYMIVDLMITRFLNSRGIKKFERDTVLGLTDKVLSRTLIKIIDVAPKSTAVHADRLGLFLFEQMQSETEDDLVSGKLSPDDEATLKIYESFASSLQEGGDLDSIPEAADTGFFATLALWETFIAKNYVIPLLKLRLETNGQAFRSHIGFLDALKAVGAPPVLAVNGKLSFPRMPPRVASAWLRYVFLVEIVQQLILEKEVIVCPRAFGTIPGIDSVNLAVEGHCDRHRKLGCGAFRPGHSRRKPRCMFEDTIRHCALEASPDNNP